MVIAELSKMFAMISAMQIALQQFAVEVEPGRGD